VCTHCQAVSAEATIRGQANSCVGCAQIRKPCPGYPFQLELQIRQYGAQPLPTTTTTTTTTTSAASTAAVPKVKREEDTNDEALRKVLLATRPITPPPRYDIQHQSLCFFLNLFCFQAGRLYAFPVFDFLPDILKTTSQDSSIYDATLAVSRLTLADQYSGKDVRLQTAREYGLALSKTQAIIKDSVTNIQDETVLSVWLLGLYEVTLTDTDRWVRPNVAIDDQRCADPWSANT
jgi:hypothetical protein